MEKDIKKALRFKELAYLYADKVCEYLITNSYKTKNKDNSIAIAGLIKVTRNTIDAVDLKKVEPEDVFGVAKVVDLYGNYKCIMPSYKRQMISLDPMIIGLIKARCRPFTGDVGTIMKAYKERIPAKIVKASAKDYNYYKKLANERVKEYNEILKGVSDLKKFPKNTEFRKKIEDAFKTYIESAKDFCYQITDEMEEASKNDSIPSDTRSKVMTIVDYLLGHLDSEKELKTF